MSERVGEYRVVDLSKKLYPGRERRRLEVRRYLAVKTGDYHSEVDLMSHLGTHVEAPYHYRDEWPDILQLPVSSFIGRGVLLRLDDIEPRAWIRAADLEKADDGRLREGDVAILDSPYHSEPFVFNADDQRPNIGEEAAQWFADKRIKSLGWGDGVAIENDIEAGKRLHEILMPQNVTFIEVMENIDQLQDDIFLIVFLPPPIAGLDSSTVRVVAMEGVPGFRPL
jgi:arylformamidase